MNSGGPDQMNRNSDALIVASQARMEAKRNLRVAEEALLNGTDNVREENLREAQRVLSAAETAYTQAGGVDSTEAGPAKNGPVAEWLSHESP